MLLTSFICFCIHSVLVDVYEEACLPQSEWIRKDTADPLRGSQGLPKVFRPLFENCHSRNTLAHMEHTEMPTTGLFTVAGKQMNKL